MMENLKMKQFLPSGMPLSAKLTAVPATAFVNPALYFYFFGENLLEEKRPL
jgi:hypothetical protein